MKKIKEKPTLSERIKEKAVSTPRELLRKGLDDGSERLRTQLRDTAQHGQADEYGGDTIEDTAARGLRRAEKELTRQRKKKQQEQPPEGGAPAADATGQKPSAIKEKNTTSAGSQPQTAAERGRQQARQNAAQKAAKVKTKDTYIGAQTETQVTVAAEPQRQGQRVFMEERGRKAARWQAEQKRAVSRRRIKTAQALHSDRDGSAMPDRMRSEQIPHIKERAETSLPKPARKKHLPMGRDIVSVSPRSKKIADTAKTLESAQKQAAMLQSNAHAAREAAVQTARYQQAAKAVQATAQKASQAAGRALRAILSAARSLAAAMMAGGSTVLSMVLVICLIGLLVASPFGIFFSGEDSGTGQTMQTAVQEINTDYQENLDEIKTSHSYDVLEMSGSRAVWKEVLAVYAVKTTTDSDNAQEVATMDDEKLELLKDIFWQMNEISSSTSTQTETVIETSDDGNGNIVETETTVTQTYLYITVSHKTAEEMANQFGFNEDQREQMAELLADENNSLWSQVLYGITGGDGEIVTVALSQVGNVGGEPYWSWYGFGSRVEWCACFVSWCANECGYIEAGVIPKFAACASQGVPWFQERGLWQDNSYEPRPGDIIFFDWDDGGQDGSSDHVGIVEKVENGRVYTVEGNSGDSVRQNSYPVGYYEIYGYGTPAC